MKKYLIIGGVVLAAIVLFSICSSTYTGVRNGGNTREAAMSAKYSSIQANYGQWRLGVTDSLGIAREKRGAMDTILQNAVGGRYNKPGSPDVDSGKLFSAIAEAYPDLAGLNVYDQVMNYVKQGREKFANDQEAMQAMIAEYNTWRTTGGLLHPTFAGWLFPSGNLKARIGDKTYTGEEALEKMSRVIVGSDTQAIFDSGNDTGIVTPEKK